ncbi:hypothetical protein LCGC14_0442530 [marine sediment metagenome]|uniref:Portal protein n=1 Tax=marine sediment metagenome TaxID=412755 RepID=A0A0F9VU22_9ZZZZ
MATNQKRQSSLTPKMSTSGLNIWGGQVMEDYLPELRGKPGIAVYNEMRKGNPIAGGFIRAIEMAFRSVTWIDIPYEMDEEGMERAAFLTSVRKDMKDPWAVFMANATTVLPFGHAPFEMTFKHRSGKTGKQPSEFTDGKVGLENLDLIPQDTIERWETEQNSPVIIAITQRAPPTYTEITIPIDKVVNFRLRTEKDNPEGESIFRQAYRPWYFMNNLEAIEGISLERTGAGIPLITLPKGATTVKDKGVLSDEQAAINIVKQVRVDEQGGIVLFDGWTFELATAGTRVDPELFDLAIKRHRSNMLISVLAAFLEFGTARVGSFALAQQSRSFFEVALEGYVSIIEEMFNKKVIPLLFELNGITDGKYPKLTHTTVGDPELEALAKYIKTLTDTGYLQPDPVLRDYLRDVARLPKGASVSERQELTVEEKEELNPGNDSNGGGENGQFPGGIDNDNDSGRKGLKRLARKMADDEGDK